MHLTLPWKHCHADVTVPSLLAVPQRAQTEGRQFGPAQQGEHNVFRPLVLDEGPTPVLARVTLWVREKRPILGLFSRSLSSQMVAVIRVHRVIIP